MFEIGSSLREARLRQGRELDEIAAATMIRVRYLEALEHERFDVLPLGPYRASFLREYAEFLGLDGDLYVSEYELRIAPPEPEPVVPPPRFSIEAARSLDGVSFRAIGIAALVVAVVGIAVWQLGGTGGSPSTAPASGPPPTTTAPRTTHPGRTLRSPPSTSPTALTLTAARGNCWLSVRIGSAAGRVVYQQTLRQGQAVRFGLRKLLWIRLGAPWNVDAALGRRQTTSALPGRTGDILAAATGLRPAP